MLEKVMKEIDDLPVITDMDEGCLLKYADVEDIIRKHMNDGWIPVEDRLPENADEMEVTLSNEDVTSAWYNRASRKWLVETRDKDGEDVKVIAWKSHSDPYRPEKGAEKD